MQRRQCNGFALDFRCKLTDVGRHRLTDCEPDKEMSEVRQRGVASKAERLEAERRLMQDPSLPTELAQDSSPRKRPIKKKRTNSFSTRRVALMIGCAALCFVAYTFYLELQMASES